MDTTSLSLGEEFIDEFSRKMRRHIWERGRPQSAKPSEETLDSLRKLSPDQDPMQMWRIGNAIEDNFWRDLENEFGPAPQYRGDDADPRQVPSVGNKVAFTHDDRQHGPI